MNPILERFLQTINEETADDIWLWLDGNPDAINVIIQELAKRFPEKTAAYQEVEKQKKERKK